MKRFPSADNLNRIAEAFKVDPADLFLKSDDSEALTAMQSKQERKDLLKEKVLKAIDESF